MAFVCELLYILKSCEDNRLGWWEVSVSCKGKESLHVFLFFSPCGCMHVSLSFCCLWKTFLLFLKFSAVHKMFYIHYFFDKLKDVNTFHLTLFCFISLFVFIKICLL